MNAPKWWASVGAALVPIAAIFGLWGQFEPALDWFVKTSILILERPTVQALLVSMTLGVLLAGWLPHFAPPWWPPGRTKALTRFVCGVVTFASCYILLAPRPEDLKVALVYCALAWIASAQLWTTASGILYRFKDKPDSLK